MHDILYSDTEQLVLLRITRSYKKDTSN